MSAIKTAEEEDVRERERDPADQPWFRWGPLVVECLCHDEKKIGYILAVKTATRELEIRVSPKGTKITTEERRRS